MLILSACSSQNSSTVEALGTISIPTSFEEKMNLPGQGKYKLVYYFDGDCSFCFATIKELEMLQKEEGFKNVHLILLTRTSNIGTFNFNLKNIEVETEVIFDNDFEFLDSNPDLLHINDILLTSKGWQVLAKGNPLKDQTVLKEMKTLID